MPSRPASSGPADPTDIPGLSSLQGILQGLPAGDASRIEVAQVVEILVAPEMQLPPTASLDDSFRLGAVHDGGGGVGAADRVEAGSDADLDPSIEPLLGGDGEPRRLGRFELQGELGHGGMGRVYAARDPDLRRTVAVKVLLPDRRGSAGSIRRFVAEAQVTSQLQHPNIVPVYELGSGAQGEVFFAMKKVEGRSLRDVLAALRRGDDDARRHWTRHRLLTTFVQVCHAVAYAHQRGVLHRDLKPENVMLGPFGEVLVMDWGIARVLGERESVTSSWGGEDDVRIERVPMRRTATGSAMGTLGYMSPEQLDGRVTDLDPRTDVWSLGAVLFEVLTLSRAWTGGPMEIVRRVQQDPPPDPRRRSPRQSVGDEIAEITMQAMARAPAERFSSAAELGEAVEGFLEGSRRREEAARQLEAGRRAWAEWTALGEEEEELKARVEELGRVVPSWAPIEEKAELLRGRDRLVALAPLRASTFARTVAMGERALARGPENAPARAFLAQAWWCRFEDAEARQDRAEQAFYEGRVREYDDGPLASRLLGTGALTLRTDPPGAEVICERYEPSGLVWARSERRLLGRTPLLAVPLEMGSYLLTLRVAGRRETRYPVCITRGMHWDSGDPPLPLHSDEEIGRGYVYVPASPFIPGGDPVVDPTRGPARRTGGLFFGEFPVTAGEYLEFLQAISEVDPGVAWMRSPRMAAYGGHEEQRYLRRPAPDGAWALPGRDGEGDLWDASWPVFGVNWSDANAFAAWRSTREGRVVRLPTEVEWEMAGRGADGRPFPWGDQFDPTLCKMEGSRPGRAGPEAVGGFPADCSPYGVRDLAGTIREWCGDETSQGNPALRPTRGSPWSGSARVCRLTNRFGMEPGSLHTYLGFRVVAEPKGRF